MSNHRELDYLRRAIVEGEAEEVERLVESALDSGIEPRSVMELGLTPGMGEVGELYESKRFFVPEVLLSAMAMKAGLSVLRPRLTLHGFRLAGPVVIGTAHGDVHDIGKNIVALTLEGAGFEVLDVGANVASGDFLSAVKEADAPILAMSALLTTTRLAMREVIEALTVEGIRSRVNVMIGGAAVSEKFAVEIGADGYGKDAVEAVRTARELAT